MTETTAAEAPPDTTAEAPADATTTETPTVETPTTETEPPTDSGDQAEGERADDDRRTDAQIGREAAKYRTRLRQTEARLSEAQTAREAAEEALTRQRQAIVDATLTAAGLDPALLTAAGHTAADLLDDGGLIDTAKLAEATREAVARFNVTPRGSRVTPNPQQGVPSAGGVAARTWGTLLGSAAKGR